MGCAKNGCERSALGDETDGIQARRERGGSSMNTAQQLVDERCRARCEKLAAALQQCQRTHGASVVCTEPHKRWRNFCVTNSACNPAGKTQDNERRCASLAKRVARCDNGSIDGQAQPSKTTDCEEQRRKWRALCKDTIVLEKTAPNTQAITQHYREAARKETVVAQAPDARLTALATAVLALVGGYDSRPARALYEHPVECIVTIAGTLCGAAYYRESSLGPASASRLMHLRVFGQAAIVATTAAVMGVVGAVDLLRGQQHHHNQLQGRERQ